MKERIFGWYPSIKDVYKDRIGVPSDHHVDCLYNFKGTMYHTKPVVPGKDNLVILGHAQDSHSRRPSTAIKSTFNHQNFPRRPKTAPVPKFRPVPKLSVPTPQECWSRIPDEKDLDFIETVAQEQNRPEFNIVDSYSPAPSTVSTQINWPLPRDQQRIDSRRERIQSASIYRNRQQSPKRPVKSAGPVRPKMTPTATPLVPAMDHNVTHQISTPSPCPQTMAKYVIPTPPSCPQTPAIEMSPSPPLDCVRPRDENGDVVPDYDKEKEKYGWAVEVHGNPYQLKKVPRRLPYTVKLDIPEVAPEPPRIHMETNETFFQNTIPRRPEVFTINKDWVSEVLHAKRIELQKREGIKYRWKNFAFVY